MIEIPRDTPHHRNGHPISEDFAARYAMLRNLGVVEERIYTVTGRNRERPGLAQALVAAHDGDTLVVPKLDRLARSMPDARAIADELEQRGVKLALGHIMQLSPIHLSARGSLNGQASDRAAKSDYCRSKLVSNSRSDMILIEGAINGQEYDRNHDRLCPMLDG